MGTIGSESESTPSGGRAAGELDQAVVVWDGLGHNVPAGDPVAVTIVDSAGLVWSPAAGAFTSFPPDDALPMVRVYSNNPVLARQWVALLSIRAVAQMALVIHHPTLGVLWYDPMRPAPGSPVAPGA
jgi:hypothetical protein